MTYSVLATTYPGGAGAFFFGIAWFVVGACSAVAAVVALVLAPFSRTARTVCGWGRVALWGGVVAVALIAIATAFIAVDRDVEFGSPAFRERIGQSLLMVLSTSVLPMAAFGALCWSRRTVRQTRDNYSSSHE